MRVDDLQGKDATEIISPNLKVRDGNETVTCRLYLCLEGDKNDGHVSLFLCNRHFKPVTASVTFDLDKQDTGRTEWLKSGDNFSFSHEISNDYQGFSNFVEKSYILDPKNNFISPDNKVTFSCDVVVKKNENSASVQLE